MKASSVAGSSNISASQKSFLLHYRTMLSKKAEHEAAQAKQARETMDTLYHGGIKVPSDATPTGAADHDSAVTASVGHSMGIYVPGLPQPFITCFRPFITHVKTRKLSVEFN
ncbi:hypothetical protein CTI12_AA510760 [Artemisia annua]|uniref:Uncharacterized protein n=1 Tax=Artemisia annua TaxID=35608 RepID=A0A2U1LBY7_ARTAN|nr:hypothetical protein CTI12_AA510760 [Artemisia annua]